MRVAICLILRIEEKEMALSEDKIGNCFRVSG